MLVKKNNKKNIQKNGFTIVELLVVIVIIAVLVSISVVVYSGVKRQAVHASVQSEASQLETQLGLYNAENGDYPTEDEFFYNSDEDCSSETDFCFDSEYKVKYDCDDWGCEYSVGADNSEYGEYDYVIGGVAGGTGSMDLTQSSDCPTNFILVPGSARYNQAGFCVMAYEARKGSNNTPVSKENGTPWSNISQSKAIEYSKNSCTGCHLITENEWMTIASDIAKVDANWTGGNIGDGLIYSGYNTDHNYYTLSNGETIYNLAGNYAEFTAGQVTGSNVTCNLPVADILCRYQNVGSFGALSANMQPSYVGTEETKNSNATKYGFGWVVMKKNDTSSKTRAIIRGEVGLLTIDIRFLPDVVLSSISAGHLDSRNYSDNDDEFIGVDIVISHVGFRVAK